MSAEKIVHLPTAMEVEQAKTSSRTLSKYADCDRVKLSISTTDNQSDEMILPGSVVQIMLDVLAEMARGNAISLIPHHQELSTQEAANLLNVSRPYLVKLLETNEIPHRKVGTHRRVLLTDILAYRDKTLSLRNSALDELTELSQLENMGY